MIGSKVAQQVMVDRHAAADPQVGEVSFGPLGELASAAESFDGREEPQGEEDLRIDWIASDVSEGRFDGLVQFGEVERLDVLPNDSNAVLGFDHLIEREQLHLNLVTLGPLGSCQATLLSVRWTHGGQFSATI